MYALCVTYGLLILIVIVHELSRHGMEIWENVTEKEYST